MKWLREAWLSFCPGCLWDRVPAPTKPMPTKPALTQQDHDADEDSHNGARAQAGCSHGTDGGTVTVLITRAHLDFYDGRVGQGRVSRVRDDDGDVIDPCLQVQNAQTELGVVTWSEEQQR